MNNQVENSSGTGKQAVLPDELRGWNWGAFLLNWIWGLGNATYIALLMFIPVFNLVFPFVLGARGNKWAWQNRKWQSIEAFRHEQRIWALVGLAVYILVIGGISGFIFMVVGIMKSSDAYQLSFAKVQRDPVVIERFGTPIESGLFVTGQVSVSGNSGNADISYSISGSKADGTVYVRAYKDLGKWYFERIEVEQDPNQERIVLSEETE